MNARAVILGVALLLGATGVSAEVAVIELRHRPAADLLPALRGAAPEDAALTGTGFRLIVRGDNATVATVRELARGLDVAAENLQISVRQADDRRSDRKGRDGEVRIDTDGEGTDVSGGVRIYNSRDSRSSDRVQSVRVQAGRPAWIDTGGSETIITGRALGRDRHGGFFAESRALRDWRDGFFVTAEVRGDEVRVQVEVVRGAPLEDGSAPRRELATTLEVPLGTWVRIAAVDEMEQRSGSGIVRRSSDARVENSAVELRVDAVD